MGPCGVPPHGHVKPQCAHPFFLPLHKRTQHKLLLKWHLCVRLVGGKGGGGRRCTPGAPGPHNHSTAHMPAVGRCRAPGVGCYTAKLQRPGTAKESRITTRQRTAAGNPNDRRPAPLTVAGGGCSAGGRCCVNYLTYGPFEPGPLPSCVRNKASSCSELTAISTSSGWLRTARRALIHHHDADAAAAARSHTCDRHSRRVSVVEYLWRWLAAVVRGQCMSVRREGFHVVLLPVGSFVTRFLPTRCRIPLCNEHKRQRLTPG